MNRDRIIEGSSGESDRPDFVMTHREVGTHLGIGRARVFYHEKSAFRAIRAALAQEGVTTAAEFESAPVLELRESIRRSQPLPDRFSPLHGWLKVAQIVSINSGCTDAPEIAQTYKLLKRAHAKLLCPPVHVTTARGPLTPYRVEAADFAGGVLNVRCWPNGSAPRTVAQLGSFECTAIVESIFDRDDQGEFDVPLLICIVVSARDAAELKL